MRFVGSLCCFVLVLIVAASGQELLSNPGFEDGAGSDPWDSSVGDPSGWIEEHSSGWALWQKTGELQNPWATDPPVSTPAHGGVKYIGVGAWGDDTSYGQYFQDVPATPGVVYILRSWAKAGTGWGAPQIGRMKLRFRDAAGNQLQENYALVPAMESWSEYSLVSDPAPAGTDHVRVIFWGMNYKHVNFDDVSLMVDDRFKVSNPRPTDNDETVDPAVVFEWDPPSEAVSPVYDVYYGSDSGSMTHAANDISVTQFDPNDLQLDTQYYWQVNIEGGESGPLWDFRTAGRATDPQPASGSYGIESGVTLYWQTPAISGVSPVYDVYFGEQGQPLERISESQPSTSLTVSSALVDDTDYQWRIDVHIAGYPVVIGDAWTFSTRDQQPLDIYILSGQSNAAGLGEIGTLVPPMSEPRHDVQLYFNGQWQSLEPGFGNENYYFGPELAFGHAMADTNPHRRIGIIKYAVGGMSLDSFFTPPGSGGPGEGYTNLVATVHDAISAVQEQADVRICGMIWAQGEAESSGDAQLAVGYEEDLRHLILDLRTEFSSVSVPNFPFIAAKVKPVAPWTHADFVNGCIDQVILSVPEVATFSTDDIQSNGDAWAHYNWQGQLELGSRFALAMQELEQVDGDYNNDGQADLQDYAAFSACCAGPEISVSDQRCLDVFDADVDGDIDLKDFSVFQVTYLPRHFLPGNDANIYYLGRNVFTNPVTPAMAWPGSGLFATFEGTSCAVQLNDTGDNYFAAVIDGNVQVINCVPGSHVYQLANDLQPGEHTFLLHKRTEGSNGAVGFEGFYLDAGSELIAPDVPDLKMEVYGDSISVGLALDSPNDDQTAPFRNNYLTYGAITARNIGAEYRAIAVSGIGIETSWWNEDMVHNYWYRHDFFNGSSQWNFSQWQADIVVVNLGQNDSWLSTPSPAEAEGYYVNFGQLLRQKYPNAILIFALGSMNATQAGSPWPGYIEAAVQTLNTTHNDPNVYSIFFPYDGLGTHPHAPQHAANAAQLTTFIETILAP